LCTVVDGPAGMGRDVSERRFHADR
jgi:hypothetical protein